MFLALLIASCAQGVESATKIYNDGIIVKDSPVEPGNLLPNFLFTQGSVEGGSSTVISF